MNTHVHAHTWSWQPDQWGVEVQTVSLLWNEDLEDPEVLTTQDQLTSRRDGGWPLHTAHHAVEHLKHTHICAITTGDILYQQNALFSLRYFCELKKKLK